MRRRDFIKLIGSVASTWPLAARAQHPAVPVIGFLNGGSPRGYAPYVAGFHQGPAAAGYTEGRNVKIEYRWAEGQYDRTPALVADLITHQVAVIATNTPPALAVKAATTTIPIVFTTSSDPVEIGLVASFARPGGNVTGITSLNAEVGPKQMSLLHELVPKASIIALLINPTNSLSASLSRDLRAAATALGLQLHVLHASSERDFDMVFPTMLQLRVGALVIGSDGFLISRSEQLAALTLRHAIPAVFQLREFIAAGGLMSYGASLADLYRQAGIYTGRILKGEKPGDLPVMQPTKFEFLINLNTAKALGLDVPLHLQQIADEVVD